jgi:hypothetical protein
MFVFVSNLPQKIAALLFGFAFLSLSLNSNRTSSLPTSGFSVAMRAKKKN